MTTGIPLDELKRLYLEERLSVPEIVARLGVTKQAVYERLHRHRILLQPRREKPSKTGLTGTDLADLYQGQKLSIRQIAERVGCPKDDVTRDLKRYLIPISYRRASKYTYLESLVFGDEITITNESGKYPFGVLSWARKLGIRITIKRLDGNTFLVTRRPILNSGTIRDLQIQGMNITTIAKTLGAHRATIARRLV